MKPPPDLGQVCAVIGAQWGDEGKGKLIDLLAGEFDVVARACGGANAGHTVIVNGKKHVFHLLPSGALHPHVQVVLGAGMVIHAPTLLEEIEILKKAGIDILPRLHISAAAHIVTEEHKERDAKIEESRSNKIGTTKRGIGPAYGDKSLRTGVRMESIACRDSSFETPRLLRARSSGSPAGRSLPSRLGRAEADGEGWKTAALRLSNRSYGGKGAPQDDTELITTRIIPNIAEFMNDLIKTKKRILIEGAQGVLLDIDHGTYPYVTSSSTTVMGALQGLGLPPSRTDEAVRLQSNNLAAPVPGCGMINSCIGVAKAYCTRVGEGPFETEIIDEPPRKGASLPRGTAERLRERGGEYGATTGRPRRIGWLSIPDLKYAAMLNGFTCWNITKLDVLDEESVIRVAVSIPSPGGRGLGRGDRRAENSLQYQDFPGWLSCTCGMTDFNKLPKKAQAYLRFIEEQTKIPVQWIGTGPDRKDMISSFFPPPAGAPPPLGEGREGGVLRERG